MNGRRLPIALGVLTALFMSSVCALGEMKTYQTKYYVLHSDLDANTVKEITRRITLMAEEFHYRTRGFAGAVGRRMPIYVFRRPQDYYDAGGLRGSAGVFMGDRLMVVAGERLTPRSWHTIQHEAFHQFAHATIGRGLPVWADEGLAEYFGHGLFTGDGFYTGIILPARCARVKKAIQEKQFPSLAEMMRLKNEMWNTDVALAHQQAVRNYDQAWSMIHFLAHGDSGRYQETFSRFLNAVSRRQPWEQAWVQSFGNGVEAFQQRWEQYWLGLPDNPTEELYAEITVATLTSFFARAFSQRQHFNTFEEFTAAAEAGTLKAHKQDWLPPALLERALKQAPRMGRWSIRKKPGRRLLVCEREDGTVLEGRFRIRNRRVQSVEVDLKPPQRKRK